MGALRLVCVSRLEVAAALTALVLFLLFKSFIGAMHRVMEKPYQGFGVSDAPFQ